MGFSKKDQKKLDEFFETSKSNLKGALKSLQEKHDSLTKEILSNQEKIKNEIEELRDVTEKKRELIRNLRRENVKKGGAKEYIQEQIVKQL